MGIRNCGEIGENLKKIVKRLMANDKLVKLLYYTDSDPYSKPNLSDQQKNELVFNKLISMIPKIPHLDNSHSMVSIKVRNGVSSTNKEFKIVQISIEVYVPWEQWFINDDNLRPFAILGEIENSLRDKTVNGLGKMDGGDFAISYLTNDIIVYEQGYDIISYD